MSNRKCKYINCPNSSITHSLFGFPINDKKRLRIWVNNCGNPQLKKLAPELLHHRYVCADHFDQCYKNTNDQQARLVKTAIPRHYKGKESNDIESEDESNEIECEKEESNNIDVENDENKSDSVDPEQATKDVEVVEILCMQCDKPIKGFGFQWWCLQCGGLRCGLCALKMVHRPHFLLRSPANTTPEQIQILIAAIQKELRLKDFFNVPDPDKHVDQAETGDVDLDAIDESLQEPIVKAEPPEEEEDPLAECTNNSSILKPDGTQTNNYYPKDRQPNSHNCIPDQKFNDSLNTHDENSSDLPLRGDIVLGLSDTDYQPGEKSLGLVNPFEYQRNLQYLGLDNTGNRASQSSGLEDSIEYRPSMKSICLESIDYEESQTPESSLDSQGWINYQPSKKSVCHEAHESIDRQSQTSKALDNSDHRPKFLDLDDFSGNFGLCRYDHPDIDDIRHSASLQTAPKGPERVPSPDPTSIELSESCMLATDKVPNTDPTNMEFSGSCSLATDRVPSPDPSSMELSGSGYESDGSSVQLETLVPNDQHPVDKDPPCSKRIRLQSCPDNIDDLINTTVPQATPIENISQQPAQITDDEPNCTEIIYEPKINKTLPLCIVYSEHQKKTIDNIHQKNDHSKTQQQIRTQIKQSYTNIIEQTNDHNKQKSVNTLVKLKNTPNRTQKPKIYGTYTKQTKNTAVQKKEHGKLKSVKTIEDPNDDPLKTQLPEIPVDSTHKDKNSTDTTEKQNNKSETQQPPIKVYSKKRSCTNTIEQKENKLKSVNIIGDPKNDPNKTQEPQIKIYSTHKKQSCKNITELKDDNSTAQEPQMQVYSTHKKRNCTDSTEHINVTKTHLSIAHKDVKSMETTEQNKDSNKIQETQIRVYSTHKVRNSKHCRTRKYS